MLKNPKSASFSHLIFPEHLSLGAIGGPSYLTEVLSISNGYEQRNMMWDQARHIFNLRPSVVSAEDYHTLCTFFRIHKGKAISFCFKDWGDYKVSHQNIGYGNDSAKDFPLVKTYYLEGQNEIRPLRKLATDEKFVGECQKQSIRRIKTPSPKTITIHINDEVVDKEDYFFDWEKHCLTFYQAPKAGCKIFADFEFYIPVRFDHDQWPATSIDASNTILELRLIEVRI